MKTSKLITALAVTAFTALASLNASARVVNENEQGTTHAHPITDQETERYLTEYLGITNYSGTSWGYTATATQNKKKYTYTANAPTGVNNGDVLFIEVNDYWKGSEWSNSPDLYNQVKYGVKAIHKAQESTKVGNGDLYHYHATTNRFFFAIKTTDFYDSKGTWTAASGTYYLQDELQNGNYNYKPFRWYNEFSTCTNTDNRWDELKASYDDLKDGDFLKAPHSCSNSLEVNHFTTLRDRNIVDDPYSAEVMLFVPTNAKATTNQKNGSYASTATPRVFFYVNKLQGERVSAATSSKFAINLNWETSFDKAWAAGIAFTPWNSTNGGVKEESHIYRKIEGQDEFTEIWVEDGLIDTKTWQDKTLPNKAKGYDVEYYVVTKIITYDRSGNRIGEEIATAPTNHVIFHIPGTEDYFELTLNNLFNSKYTPVAGKIRNSYNKITSTVTAEANQFSPTLEMISKGDKFVLYREEEGKGTTAVNTLTIDNITTQTFLWTTTTSYTYTFNGEQKSTSNWNEIQDILDIVGKCTDEVESVPGHIYDVHYQLVYTSAERELYSNVVSAQSKRTDVEVKKVYRSGTPDPSQNATKELYTVDVRFKPILSDDIAYYHIWRNAEEKVVRIGQAGTSFTLIGKNEDGNFNIDLGPITPDEDGYITIPVDYAMNKHVCDYEEGQGQALDENDLFFTVEVCTTGNNSYGNSDKATDFNGEPSELVLNTYGTFYVGDATRPGQYCAEISWDKIKNSDNISTDDYVKGEPDYYTVYRCRVGSDKFEPITKFFRGHNARYDESGKLIEAGEYTLVDQTTDGRPYKFTPAIIEQVLKETGDENFYVVDFLTDTKFVATPSVTFPATYYVKAHYDSEFKTEEAQWITDDYTTIQNYVEKNSNPTHATTIIVTGVSENTVSKVVSTTYYSIMGYPVAHPAQGQVVIAQSKHADGSTSAKVVKF